MIQIRRYRSSEAVNFDELLSSRKTNFPFSVIETVTEILSEVRTRGDEALLDFAERFDGVRFDSAADLRVSEEEIEAALEALDEEDLDALDFAGHKIAQFHDSVYKESWFKVDENGSMVGSKVSPLRRVGIYVPGGRAFYPSSVLMNALPAVVAGVEEIVMVTPSREDGSVHPVTLASALIAGVTEVYRVGGAQAIAALAFGTDSIAPVDKIVGPGNIYVAAAKHLVSGEVGIDMIAGPSEVLVLADKTARPRFVAIDLIAQAEHDPKASTYLVTNDAALIDAVEREIGEILSRSPRREVSEESLLANCYFILVPNMDEAVEIANLIAPEHLEVQCDDAQSYLGKIRNAGAIFLGHWTPESIGDYVAGPNHVLPTSGTARFASPLSTEDFIKRSSVLSYNPESLMAEGPFVERIAAMEGLWAHGEAVTIRLTDSEIS